MATSFLGRVEGRNCLNSEIYSYMRAILCALFRLDVKISNPDNTREKMNHVA